MSRSRLPAVLLAILPAFAADSAAAEEPDGRYPVWPSEIDRIAAPLRDPAVMAESARLAALEELSEYATEVILPDLELALTDPSPEIRAAALQMCASRRVLACVDEAEKMWEEGEGSIRLTALQLLSQDPTPEHLELVYEAMRDSNDLIREQAIMLLVDAPLSPEMADGARQELVAQLGDFSARVRRTAASSLGRMGPGEGALALVRLLDDVDINVAQAAAVALGQMADPRTAPALQRALESPNNANFASAAVEALARLPGPEIDEALLALLDAPPRNLRRDSVAQAIGGRPDPGSDLIIGLVERMRDPGLRDPATLALLWLGDRAVAALEAAVERGLEPDIALEVERLLEARRLQPTRRDELDRVIAPPPAAPLPGFDDRETWFDLLGDPEAIDAAAELGAHGPEWLGGALSWQIERGSTAAQLAPWLTALAVSPEPLLDEPNHAVAWARIAGWAADTGASVEARCLATMALARAAGTRHAEQVRSDLQSLAAAHSADVRACAALSLARFGEDPLLEALLADPSARVRASTALALRQIRKPAEQVRARLALQADRDTQMRTRSSAALALESRDPKGRLVLLRGRPAGGGLGAREIEHWQRFVIDGREVDVPLLGAGAARRGWAIVPLEGAVPAEVDTGSVVIPEITYRYDYHYHYH